MKNLSGSRDSLSSLSLFLSPESRQIVIELSCKAAFAFGETIVLFGYSTSV